MSFRTHRLFCVIAVACALSCATFAATPVTYLYLNSQPGDFIGQGITQKFTPADGSFSVSNITPSIVRVSFHNSDYSQSWDLSFGTPTAVKFAKGQSVIPPRSPFRSPVRPWLYVDGDGHACDTTSGQFLVSDFALALDGTVARLAIDFEQHCESFAPALYGSIRYNSSVSQVSRLGIGAVDTLKGNTGTSDALATIALSIPSATPVTVQYATVDGTALQGTDYVASTGTVTFPAGTTSQTVVVPVFGDRLARGNKKFTLRLNTPTGGLIGTASASVMIRDPNVTMNVLAMSSQPGDYIGLGLQYLITPADGTFTPSTLANMVRISINSGDDWETFFAGPSTTRLTAGEYLNAQRYPFQPAGTPGLSIFGAGSGCNTLTGNFDVLKAGYSATGLLQSFSADFEQHCEGLAPALFGWVRFHSLLQQFSVADAAIQGSSAVFTVTLNPALAKSVTVTFSTADGSAVAGVDYAATTTSLTFSPGMTAQTVTVPLLSSGNAPQKTFSGQLSSPSGAAVWISQGSAAF